MDIGTQGKMMLWFKIPDLDRVCTVCEGMVDEEGQEGIDTEVDNDGVESTDKDSLGLHIVNWSL